jgi:hypothetical protein
MYTNPYLASELVRGRQRELLAYAERQRRASHGGSCTAQQNQRSRPHLRRALHTAARLRAVFQA